MLNIQIPQSVGSIINVLTKICQNKNDSTKNVILQLAQPAFILARMYIAQVYIYKLLSDISLHIVCVRSNIYFFRLFLHFYIFIHFHTLVKELQ